MINLHQEIVNLENSIEEKDNFICHLCECELSEINSSSIEPEKLCENCYDYALERAKTLPITDFPLEYPGTRPFR